MMKQTAYLVALVWASTAVALTSVQTKPAAQLVVLGLFLVIGGLHGIFRKKAWGRYPVAGLIFLMFLGASLVSFIQLGLWLFPPVTPDGQSVMPVGQTFAGSVLGFLFCVLVSWLYFARLKPDPRAETIWVYVTFVVLGIAFTVDYLF